jgi:hypothetical protein
MPSDDEPVISITGESDRLSWPDIVAASVPPTSLTEAVIREVIEADDEVPSARSPSPPPTMLDVAELKPRASARPAVPKLPSLPPDAIVPAEDAPHADAAASMEEPSVPAAPPSLFPASSARAAYALVQDEGALRAAELAPERSPASPAEPAPDTQPSAGERQEDNEPLALSRSSARPAAPRRALVEKADKLPERSLAGPLLLLVVVVASAVAVCVAVSGPRAPVRSSSGVLVPASGRGADAPSAAPVLPPDLVVPPAPMPVGSEQPAVEPAGTSPAPPAEVMAGEDLALPPGSTVPRGQGLLEVRTLEPDAVVWADGQIVGGGPASNVVIAPGEHEVRVTWRNKRQHWTVRVKADRRLRITAKEW